MGTKHCDLCVRIGWCAYYRRRHGCCFLPPLNIPYDVLLYALGFRREQKSTRVSANTTLVSRNHGPRELSVNLHGARFGMVVYPTTFPHPSHIFRTRMPFHPSGSDLILRPSNVLLDARIMCDPINQAMAQSVQLSSHEPVFDEIAPVDEGVVVWRVVHGRLARVRWRGNELRWTMVMARKRTSVQFYSEACLKFREHDEGVVVRLDDKVRADPRLGVARRGVLPGVYGIVLSEKGCRGSKVCVRKILRNVFEVIKI